MLWGSFGLVHIVSLILAVGINVALYYILKNRSERTKIITLFILSFAGIAAILFNLLRWGSPLEYLPFHMCSITAMMLPFAVITRNRILSNLLLIWALGAVFALVVNFAQANFEVFSSTFAFYYFPHTLEAGIPILLFKLKLCKKDYRTIPFSVGITLGIYTVVHFINLGVNSYCLNHNIVDYAGEVVKVNYMYSLVPENPLLQLFRNIIPFDYFYMFLVIPILLVYLVLMYLPQILRARKEKKEAKEALSQ